MRQPCAFNWGCYAANRTLQIGLTWTQFISCFQVTRLLYPNLANLEFKVVGVVGQLPLLLLSLTVLQLLVLILRTLAPPGFLEVIVLLTSILEILCLFLQLKKVDKPPYIMWRLISFLISCKALILCSVCSCDVFHFCHVKIHRTCCVW